MATFITFLIILLYLVENDAIQSLIFQRRVLDDLREDSVNPSRAASLVAVLLPVSKEYSAENNDFSLREFTNPSPKILQKDDEHDRLQRSDKKMLRSIWKGCSKKAMKVCKKACEAAVKTSCSMFDCKKKLKKSLKKSCKSHCKSSFQTE